MKLKDIKREYLDNTEISEVNIRYESENLEKHNKTIKLAAFLGGDPEEDFASFDTATFFVEKTLEETKKGTEEITRLVIELPERDKNNLYVCHKAIKLLTQEKNALKERCETAERSGEDISAIIKFYKQGNASVYRIDKAPLAKKLEKTLEKAEMPILERVGYSIRRPGFLPSEKFLVQKGYAKIIQEIKACLKEESPIPMFNYKDKSDLIDKLHKVVRAVILEESKNEEFLTLVKEEDSFSGKVLEETPERWISITNGISAEVSFVCRIGISRPENMYSYGCSTFETINTLPSDQERVSYIEVKKLFEKEKEIYPQGTLVEHYQAIKGDKFIEEYRNIEAYDYRIGIKETEEALLNFVKSLLQEEESEIHSK
jgi:hypothetical protein